ncbi:MBL fold metallo-hydrolase [Streptomyces physcomitrii]|uniref:MBL fold metallo-hydrolase n=1 Tax=Streptomyces physcomitrii TaxID=2724184 RepID=A0ABX1GWI7_9ACTN|nr:MBL fold metallo-hydrolase [Streptomyces physcomitrii]NKI40132.1 MBL fold metallo-hydrolase [Streptomyces physcomitrii]
MSAVSPRRRLAPNSRTGPVTSPVGGGHGRSRARTVAGVSAGVSAAVAGAVAVAGSFRRREIALPGSPFDFALPPAPGVDVSVSVAETGVMRSNAVFAYRGGGFEQLVFGMDSLVVRHPERTLLVDTGFGRRLREHTRTVPRLMRAVSAIELDVALADRLAAGGLGAGDVSVVLTHAHWDHVSGLEDLPGVPVHVNAAERDFIRTGGRPTELIRGFGELNYQLYDFDNGPYAGFPESHDLLGDGSVVLVPVGGHTPGSVLVFVRTPGRDLCLIGDQAWQREGVDLPAERPWVSCCLVDHDAARVRANLGLLHRLQEANPELLLVPAHDRGPRAALPRFA